MQENMNILHITTFLQGGAGRLIADLACSQILKGHNVTVATSSKEEEDYKNYIQWIERIKSQGGRTIFVESTFKRDLSQNLKAFQQIKKVMDKDGISVIHSHAAIPSLIALLLRSCANHRIPIIQTMHGWGIRKTKEQADTDIILMNQADRIIATSETSKKMLIHLGIKSKIIKIITNGISDTIPKIDEKKASRLRQWKSKGMKVMICIGTVGERKNQRFLLQAMAHPKAPKDIACAVIGEGKEIVSLKAFSRENGLKDKVHFYGYQKEGAQFLNYADWLVLPSKDEGLPLSILEAYRAGIPVIASNIPEISEVVVHEKTGILFQANDLESFVNALIKIDAMPEKNRIYFGKQSNYHWKMRYRMEKMLHDYEQIYAETIKLKG